VLQSEESRSKFGPYESRIHEVVNISANDYFTGEPPDFIARHNDRERANCIYSHMRYHALRVFADVPEVRPRFKRGLFMLVFGDWGILKFKFLGRDLRTRNAWTQQTFAWLNQYSFGDQIPLPDMPEPATHFHAGYQLNELKTGVEGIFITAPNGRDVEYYWQIDEEPGSGQVVDMPTPQAPMAPAAQRRPIAPKKSRDAAQNE
jgi:hypothetical protein